MSERYDSKTASPRDRVAWALCQIIDEDAPLRWTRYRFAAGCIAGNPEVMADLRNIAPSGGGQSDEYLAALDHLFQHCKGNNDDPLYRMFLGFVDAARTSPAPSAQPKEPRHE